MRITLKALIVITCIALAGMISLQVFWLAKTYKERRKQLIESVATRLIEYQVFSGLHPELINSVTTLATGYVNGVMKHSGMDGVVKIQDKTLTIDAQNSTDQQLAREIETIIMDKKAGSTLEEFEESFRQSLAESDMNAPFAIALFDENGRFVAATIDSAEFRKRPDIVAGSIGLPVKLNEKQEGYLRLAFENITLYLVKEMWVVFSLSVFFTLTCIAAFIYLLRNFFKEKKLAQMRADFMNNITHELKTPVSAVALAIELLREDEGLDRQKQRQYMDIADKELSRLHGMIDNILVMAAFEQSAIEPKLELVAFTALFENLLAEVNMSPFAEQAAITTNVEPADLCIEADANLLNAILRNLIENAVKYRKPGMDIAEIRLDVRKTEQVIQLLVSDKGIGIPSDYHDKIFEKFFRVASGDRHDIPGYGLGLSYVKEIVKIHHWEITVESSMNSDTTFYINIPLSLQNKNTTDGRED